MTVFNVSAGNMFNILITAVGIGICGMNILQVSTGARLPKEATRYFQLFFGTLLLYIGSYLARQLMEGVPGQGIRVALIIVTLLEFLASGVMAWFFSQLTLYVASPERHQKFFQGLFLGILMMHTVLMIVSQFTDLCYYYDSANIYRRSPAYLLSNLAHIGMLCIDAFLLVRWKDKFSPRIRHAFWVYIIAPIVAIAIQAFFKDVKLIILGTVASAVYMSMVIMQDQMEKFERDHETATRVGAELSMAKDIQASQLPSLFPAFPNRPEFDIFASMKPAREVGGDFYDFFMIDDDHIGLVMADVSGKGVPAALFMMASKIIISNNALMGKSPAQVLSDSNTALCANGQEDMFVTVWIGILELSTGKLTAANGGHEYPVLMKDGHFVLYHDDHGLLVGGMPGITYDNYEIQLKPGDKLFLYTDGVPEANNKERKLFGTERMVSALNKDPAADPQGILKNVRQAVDQFVNDAEQFDDLTMLCIEYKKG